MRSAWLRKLQPHRTLLLAVAATYFAHLWGFTVPLVSALYLFCGLIPFYLYLGEAHSAREGFKRGWFFGFLSHLAVCFWMIETLRLFTGWPWIAGTLGGLLVWIGISAFSALPMGALGYLHGVSFSYFRDRKLRWLFFLPAAVYVVECLVPKYFPDTLGEALYALRNIRQIADLGGVWLLTSLLFAVNGCVHLAVFHCRKSKERALLGGLALLMVLGAHVYGKERLQEINAIPTTTLRPGIVQPGFNASIRLRNAFNLVEEKQRILDEMFGFTEELVEHHPQWVLWPETSYPDTFFSESPTEDTRMAGELKMRVGFLGVPLWVGARDQIGRDRFNTFYALTPPAGESEHGEFKREFYHKRRLLALSESVPFASTLQWLEQKTGAPLYSGLRKLGMSNFKEGADFKLFALHTPQGEFRFAPQICFEGLLPFDGADAAMRGAHGFVNLTNDAWFGNAWLSEQNLHLYLTAFRSVEVRRPILRVTSTGKSAAIDATGDVHAFSGYHEGFTGVVDFPVALQPSDSFFAKHPYTLLTLALILCVIAGALIFNGLNRVSSASLQSQRRSKS